MNIKNTLLVGLTALGLSLSAQASNITVGDITWDPESKDIGAADRDDFVAVASTQGAGNEIFGTFSNINSWTPAQFCATSSCQLAFTIKTDINDITTMSIYDTNPGVYNFADADALVSTPWLVLESTDFSAIIASNSTNAYFNAVSGKAFANFDTDSIAGNPDNFDFEMAQASLSSGAGSFTLEGNSIPEPTSIALLGLGLIGFAASRKRKA